MADCTNMPEFEDNSFDVVIDKSTIDALLCGESSFIMTAKMMKEIQRIMKVGGVYIAISYGDPDSRQFHFEREFLSWDIKLYKMFYNEKDVKKEEGKTESEDADPKIHYVYVCTKRKDAD